MSVIDSDPDTGDWARDTSFIRVEGEQEIRLGVDTRLQTFAGEYPWDLDGVGTRMLEVVLVKGVPLSLVLGELTRRILSQPGMVSVDEIDAEDLGAARSVRVPWQGTADVGTLAELLKIQGTTDIPL